MKAAAANLEFEKAAALRDRIKRLREPRSRAGREPAAERGRGCSRRGLKDARPRGAGVRAPARPGRPRPRHAAVLPARHHRAVRRDRHRLADGRAADRACSPGMVLALQSGITLDQFGARSMVGRLVSASMVKELGPVLTGADGDGPRRLGHRRRARIDGGDRSDRRAARARHRSGPQARRAARARRHPHGAGADRHLATPSAWSAAGSSRVLQLQVASQRLLEQRRRRASTSRTSGWGSSSRSSSASRS